MLACEHRPLLTETTACSLIPLGICSSPAGCELSLLESAPFPSQPLEYPKPACSSPRLGARSSKEDNIEISNWVPEPKGPLWASRGFQRAKATGPNMAVAGPVACVGGSHEFCGSTVADKPSGPGRHSRRSLHLSNNDSFAEHPLWAFWS